MRHQVDHRKLGRHTSHRRALLKNMATSLIKAERIETTLPKAKELRRVADELITLGKEGTLHARRLAARIIQDDEALRKLFSTLAPRFNDRNGGYTRIYKYGFRRGDSAEMAAIEYLGYQIPVKVRKEEEEDADEAPKAEKKKAVKAKAEKAEKKENAEKPKKTTKKASAAKTGKEEKDAEDKKGKWGIFGKKGKKESDK